jgi:hypothetical protein
MIRDIDVRGGGGGGEQPERKHLRPRIILTSLVIRRSGINMYE